MPTGIKSGVIFRFTFTVIVAFVAHNPGLGLKVYVVVAILLIAGDHVPANPSREVFGSVSGSPVQIGVIVVKVGIVGLFTLTVIVALVAHNPGLGLKVYVVVAILLIAGDQVPAKPSRELFGSVSGSPAQIGAIVVNVGLTGAPTLTVILVGMAQVGVAADVGVNV